MIYWLRKLFTNPSVHLASAFEVLVTAIFSLVPPLVTLFVLLATDDSPDVKFTDIVERGQFFLLTYGLFGTVLWLAFLRKDVPRHDARVFLGVISILVIIPIVGFMGVDPTFEKVQNPTVIKLSYYFYGSLLLINYLLLFYCHIEPPEPQDSLNKGASEMRRKLEETQNAK